MKISKFKIIVLILASILLAKIIITLVALPKASIDYTAEYNELTKPADFTPEENAADYYLKACELYIEPSEELYSSHLMVEWYEDKASFLTDIDPEDLLLLEQWIISNQPAIDQIRLAIPKPYCWFQRKSETGHALGITFPEATTIRHISEVFIYSARLNAIKKNFRSAIDDIIDCYHIGQHQCWENISIIDQYLGIRIKTNAIKTALDILSYSKPAPEELEYFQDSLQAIIDTDSYIPGLEAEKLFLYDNVQRIYLDWIRGINRPAFRVLCGIRCLCDDNNFLWVNAFVGSSRGEILSQIDRFFDLHNQLRDKTQWQIHHQYANQLSEIEAMSESNFFMELCAPPSIRVFSLSQKQKAQAEALIAVLAILRYKADNNRLPETLEELIANGYLNHLPQDPYSEGNLRYRVLNDDFVLYSIGEDFEDNNGEPIIIEEDTMFGFPKTEMPGMTPLKDRPQKTIKRTVYNDVVYWPVTDIPQYFDRNRKF